MWQIFVVGTVVLIAALFLPVYESAIAGIGAIAILAVVLIGFIARPRRDVFYVRTTVYIPDPDYAVSLEHDRIAIRVELARLWLLFVPTFSAVAFLLVTFLTGTMWKVSIWSPGLFSRFFDVGPYNIFLVVRVLLLVVLGLLATWVSERWVLRDAKACSAGSVSALAGRLLYMFNDESGEYFGGEAFPFGLVRPRQLSTIVFYRIEKPQLNKIAMGLLFHRLVIIGRGITDLDGNTVATRLAPVPAISH